VMFRKKRSQEIIDQPANKKVWKVLDKEWDKCKIRFAAYLSEKTRTFSPNRLRLLLYIFLCICTVISFYIILSPFTNASYPTAWQKQTIQIPFKTYERDQAIRYADSPVSYKNYKRIERFEKYLDSLCSTAAGKEKYDSLIRLHPGLIDSLFKLKEIYSSQ
jgi:hypothetical protein